ncbi:Toxoplasma gondii family A protein [Toxoplasma gondii ME49]|uniref:Toxoplasma gondii family A protein n=1 Tax=Toxoplasma gondii (strain ATCC 50611 / Me49) TaxID=508771 RepID=S8GGS8_TOXGM|nr:Toxoplasma gondii family A protein [Toxoplasma gondii ME49]EPT27669.1 Toxoplasma gondii family A protein [Toxoplasma gondii ME49]|eukprot:XP_018636277.1 Toxoplasma gondii family A protein [Toxoplasma gondii ME49]
MASAPVRVVCLAVLMASIRHCATSEISDTLIKTDFSITIPKEGLQAHVEKIFHLGPSQTLGVFDFSNSASYLPASPATETGKRSSDQVGSSAFAFENGKCNFDRVIGYNQLFPGYETPLWVRASSPANSDEEGSTEVTTYKFTNPPEENLYGRVSFCIRFNTVGATEESDGTSVTTQRPTSGSSESQTENPQTSPGESTEQDGQTPSPAPPSGGPDNNNSDPSSGSEDNDGVNQNGEDGQSEGDAGETESSVPGTLNNHVASEISEAQIKSTALSSGATPGYDAVPGQEGVQTRRLSEQSETKDPFYLTIVVHSAAWGLVSNATALWVSLCVMVATLLQTVW